jgi:hypothetical protein
VRPVRTPGQPPAVLATLEVGSAPAWRARGWTDRAFGTSARPPAAARMLAVTHPRATFAALSRGAFPAGSALASLASPDVCARASARVVAGLGR